MALTQRKHYISGFDGLRTLAVVAVIGYHLFPDIFKGGYLGVVLFFVLSGYLITDLMIKEYTKTKTIALKAFYKRRFFRLYPALIFLFLVTSISWLFIDHSLLTNFGPTSLSSILGYNNLFQINQDMSYFAQWSAPTPFTHLWSLAVEAQFYLIWPIITLLLLKSKQKKSLLSLVPFGLALASVIFMAASYRPHLDVTPLYYGSFTRMHSILLGAGFAFIYPSAQAAVIKFSKPGLKAFMAITYASIALLVSMMFKLDAQSSFLYLGGFGLFSLVSALIVIAIVTPRLPFNHLFTNPFNTYIGKRSYGIYLWQYPVLVTLDQYNFHNEHPYINSLVALAIIIIITEFSYKYVEIPLQKNYQTNIKKFFNALKQKRKYQLATCLTLVLFVSSLILAPSPVNNDMDELAKIIEANNHLTEKGASNNEENNSSQVVTGPVIDEPHLDNDKEYELKYKREQARIAAEKKAKAEAAKKASQTKPKVQSLIDPSQWKYLQTLPVSAFGDSVMLAGADPLSQALPKMKMDAHVGQQVWDIYDKVTAKAKDGTLSNTVLIGLGTNGNFKLNSAREMIEACGDRQIYWITVKSPSISWESSVNKNIKTLASEYDNVHVIDWKAASSGHDDWFYNDDTHPNTTGALYYTKTIAQAIKK